MQTLKGKAKQIAIKATFLTPNFYVSFYFYFFSRLTMAASFLSFLLTFCLYLFGYKFILMTLCVCVRTPKEKKQKKVHESGGDAERGGGRQWESISKCQSIFYGEIQTFRIYTSTYIYKYVYEMVVGGGNL